MESRMQALYPIVSALVAAEQFLGKNRAWHPTNDEQRDFLGCTFGARTDLGSIPDITSTASYDAAVINKFLADRGFHIQLDPFTTPGEFGTASVLDVLVEWIERGTTQPVVRKGTTQTYPGVRVKPYGRSVIESPHLPNLIAMLMTKTGDEVYLTALEPQRASALLERPGVAPELPKVEDHDIRSRSHEFNDLIFPMVSLDQRVDIGWLRGLTTRDDCDNPAIVGQALQQTRFRMNDVGARAESAVAVGVLRLAMAAPKRDFIIEEPFLLWIRRRDCRLPLFVGYFDTNAWKDPGDLGR